MVVITSEAAQTRDCRALACPEALQTAAQLDKLCRYGEATIKDD
jgi:hypothetical protein